MADARDFIAERYGRQFLPDSPNIYKSKKDAQDAHEAIRPTSMAFAPEVVERFLAEDEMKLYRLIWNRFVASQMMPALFDQTTIDVAAKGKNGVEYLFRATGSVLKFEGFLKVYQEGKDQADEEDEELKHRLPAVAEGERLRLRALKPEQHFTEPPPRYNEATLVKKLEADGVGRPSTYASILSTIQEREYVKKEGGRFTPTELGMVVTDLLLESFDDIFDVTYTARMEEELDEIEEGKLDWRAAMAEFYEKFESDLKHAEEHMTDIKRMEKPTDLICEKCGKPLVIKWGKHGSFIACTGYPECTYTRELTVDLPDVDKADLAEQGDEEYCENCGRPMVLKKGRFGTFFACTGYPDCKTTKPIGGEQKKPDQPLDEKCPQCGSQPGAEDRPLRRVHRVQQLPGLQVRQAEDHRGEVPGVLARARSWSAAPSAARRSTAATAIRTASSSPGASRWRKSARSAAAPTWWRSGSRPARSGSAPTPSASTSSPLRSRLKRWRAEVFAGRVPQAGGSRWVRDLPDPPDHRAIDSATAWANGHSSQTGN